MAVYLDSKKNGVEAILSHARVAAASAWGNEELSSRVYKIITRIREEGDAAVLALTQQFDDAAATIEGLKISPAEQERLIAQCSDDVKSALRFAAERIEAYHRRQLPQDFIYTDSLGVELGNRWVAMERVGLYVPGGKASYPSSVLMNAIPARVAGVKDIAMVVPAPQGEISPAVIAAAHISGVTEIYKIGGAQAVAALAFGTKTIRAVDKIVGPGNAYVAEAKRQLFGVVGIDMVAGPSEIVVVAEDSISAEWVAADLLSQAEHDENARSILITFSESFARKVEHEVERILSTLPRQNIARASWENNGVIITVKNREEALTVVNGIAPEHLELCVEKPKSWLGSITHAGAVFLGHHTPEAIGDYSAGPSHVLPTSGTARFSSGLSVFDFLRRQSIIECSQAGFSALSKATQLLADSEGLQAHRLSVSVRD